MGTDSTLIKMDMDGRICIYFICIKTDLAENYFIHHRQLPVFMQLDNNNTPFIRRGLNNVMAFVLSYWSHMTDEIHPDLPAIFPGCEMFVCVRPIFKIVLLEGSADYQMNLCECSCKDCLLQWNLSVTTTSTITFISRDLFSYVF